jgi:adenylate cyclase
VTAAIIVVLGLLVTGTVTWLPPWKALCATIALLLTYGAINCVLLFDYGDRIVGLAGPLVVIGAVWGSLTLFRFVVERNERARITRKFRGYVDPQLVEYVVQHPEISRFVGQVREMTVCFSDLAGFTSMAEQLKEAAVPILGRYINRMVTTMRKHRGLLNRLMGDGIMFSYGAPLENPNHAEDAVATVMEMQQQLAELNRELAEEGHPQLALRAGVSTGKVVVGDSGGTEAVDYTCIGDTTNLGARLESANKFTGTKNLISGRTAELLNGKYLLRPVALLQVVGKKFSVMTYEPLAKTEAATDEQRKLVAMTQEMIDHYQAGRFEHCIAAADELDEAFRPSKLAKLYRDTCDRYIIERAPDGFIGQIVLSEK